MVHLVWKLLHGDAGARSLLANDPFPGRAPGLVRVRLFRYRLNRYGEPGWWTREERGEWLPPFSVTSPRLRLFLAQYGWVTLSDEEHQRLIDQYHLLEQQVRHYIVHSNALIMDLNQIVSEHEPLVRAIIAGDAVKAERLARAHNAPEVERAAAAMAQEHAGPATEPPIRTTRSSKH